VVGNTKVVFKVGDRVKIAIDAIKPLRDVALQSNIDRIKWMDKGDLRGAAGEHTQELYCRTQNGSRSAGTSTNSTCTHDTTP
jgi:hypothetical protein